MPIRVEEYLREDGSSPYKKWFDSLDAHAAAKVATAKIRLELGNTSSVKWFDGMGEYVIDWGPGFRIYLAKVRIPVNVTADSGIVTGIPMNVTGAGVARIDCSLRLWFSGFWLLFIEHSRWLWSLWSKGCAVGNSKSCPRQAPRCAAGASSTNPQPRMCGFVSVRFRRLRPHYRVIRQSCSLLPPPSCGSTRRPA